jgi:hypothetical protein
MLFLPKSVQQNSRRVWLEYLIYPWRCLCLGLLQITRTTPRRWITLHLSQIFFTDARTFMLLTPKATGPKTRRYKFYL